MVNESTWQLDVLPRVLPAGWHVDRDGYDGRSYMNANGLLVFASASVELDGKRWLHVSVSRRSRLPSWEDLRAVKDAFIGRDRTALQVLPPAAKHVNIHAYCLHLWSCLDGDPTPDFTRGSGSI